MSITESFSPTSRLIACYSAAGGAGTTVIASCLAFKLRDTHPHGVLLVDLAGDVPAVMGIPGFSRSGPGVAELVDPATADMAAALGVAQIRARNRLDVLPRGGQLSPPTQADTFTSLLAEDPRLVIVDCGTRPQGLAAAVARAADRSLLVTRLYYSALRRAEYDLAVRPTGVVVLAEPHRSLTAELVPSTVGAPVIAEVPYDEGLARAVDAGLLSTRQLPRSTHALEPLTQDILGHPTPDPTP